MAQQPQVQAEVESSLNSRVSGASSDDEPQQMGNGGFVLPDQEVQKAQREFALDYIKRLGKSIFGGSIMHKAISAAPGVFSGESQLETLAMHFQSRQHEFEDPICKLLNISLSVLYNSVQSQLKPFNPIIGETLLGQSGDYKIAAEQIANHPPTCLIRLKGLGVEIDSAVALSASLRLNGVVVKRAGLSVVKCGAQQYVFSIPKFCLHGLLYGERWGNFAGDIQYWTDIQSLPPAAAMISAEMSQQADFAVKIGTEAGYDKVSGQVSGVAISGSWTSVVRYGSQIVFDAAQIANYGLTNTNQLPSDQALREDIAMFKAEQFEQANEIKTRYEEQQRQDRKFRVM